MGRYFKPVMSPDEAVRDIPDGATIMVGGFNVGGVPYSLIEALIRKGVKDITLIANDTLYENIGHGKLVANGQVKKVIASHIGLNKITQKLYNEGKLEVEFVPQGTFAERIRAGGFGLGGILTPTGVGTMAEEGKQLIEINGRKYILELPLRADFALIRARKADRVGNLWYWGNARNFNPLMAAAADVVIAEVDVVLGVGDINPNDVHTPGILVDRIVVDGGEYYVA
ncbi:MAG: CoA transferase subunit A [Synergistetes bacterium]|nr:CoA transferase subunit A [Synergistota bacterium]